MRLHVRGLGDVLFCHGTPRSDVEIFTRLTAEERLFPAFEGVDAAVVVCGHTHMPFDRTVRGIRVVNAGSVGMPFGDPGAYWLLLGPDVSPRHQRYDLEAAAARIRASDYPQAEAFAAGHRPAAAVRDRHAQGVRAGGAEVAASRAARGTNCDNFSAAAAV